MKTILIALVLSFYTMAANADVIKMFGKEIYGYNQPKYVESYEKGKGALQLIALAEDNNFPLFSSEQGSVFNKIFLDMIDAVNIKVSIVSDKKNYQEKVASFERGELVQDDANIRLGVYYEEYPYSHNEYIYPAFYENKIYVIMSQDNILDLQTKSTLKNYKGVYVKTDKLPKHVVKELNNLGAKPVDNLNEAYKQLLTNEADYIAAGYYPSAIEAYKLGIRDYVAFSKNPVWKASMFLRTTPEIARHPQIEKLQQYLKSSRYKKVRDDAFDELMEIYKINTQGIIPPLYITSSKNEKEDEK